MASSSWREPTAERLQWVKCRYCPRKFFKADAAGRIEIVCPRCKALQTQDLKRRA